MMSNSGDSLWISSDWWQLPEVAQVLMACDRMALSRVHAAFPKKRSRKINVLKGLLRTASPPVKKALQTLGLVCSPQTAERHIACELVVRQIPQLNSVELLINIGDSLTRCEWVKTLLIDRLTEHYSDTNRVEYMSHSILISARYKFLNLYMLLRDNHLGIFHANGDALV